MDFNLSSTLFVCWFFVSLFLFVTQPLRVGFLAVLQVSSVS